MHANWAHVVRGAAALAAAMGIGRFAYTPILPLMTAQAELTPQLAGNLATANYVGYLAGALAGTASAPVGPVGDGVAGVAGRAGCNAGGNAIRTQRHWLAGLAAVAGFTSALVFVIAVNSMLDHLDDHPAHLPGWAFGGVGVGIALSAALVLVLPARRLASGLVDRPPHLAAVLSAAAWSMAEPAVRTFHRRDRRPMPRRVSIGAFALLFGSYTLEGIGYIIAGTFLVAAVAQHSPGWLGNGAWLVVGLAATPSAALWAWLSAR